MAVYFTVLVGFFVYLLYKVYAFVRADGDFTLLSHSLKPNFFKDKVIWVTGASSGIGEELCRQLSPLGAKLILSARSQDKLERISQSLARPENARVLVLDMLDSQSFDNVVTKAQCLFGRIDILVNNAGIAMRSEFINVKDESSLKLFKTNFLSTIFLTKRVIKVMIDQSGRGGDIVNIASVSGKGGGVMRHYYGASKAALLSVMDSLRIDFIDNNINFINILPGPVQTDITLNALSGDGSRYGINDPLIANGMKVDRCCHLILVAMSNRLMESWISAHPYLYLTYLGQYAPSLQVLATLRIKRGLRVSMNAARGPDS